MTTEARMTLGIADPEGCDDANSYSIPVSTEVVDYTIDLLQCFLAQYRRDVGIECQADTTVWGRLAVAAGHALAGLLSAHNVYYHDGGARHLIEEIALFCLSPDVPRCIEPLRAAGAVDVPTIGPQPAQIIDALLALWEQGQRQRRERTQQQAVAEQEPAAEREVGWDF
jgi:hypothetical protein